ncbi:unnamed protein product [Phytophthora lilii]|uniref:Unnamed protein product n=1 Tax=Phytophthora lilii TaxID=2077276 RepID=A0A9W7CJW3_9STRA|nr:unnamed protein product [Phytophthora lilii]
MLDQPRTVGRLFGFGNQRPHYVVQPGSISLVTPIAQPTNAKEQAGDWGRIALLNRGGQYPPVYALNRKLDGINETVVCGQSLWQVVVKIASMVGYQLPTHTMDGDKPGQCSANHAEKQLAAYFICKHLFLPDDVVSEDELHDLLCRRQENKDGEPDEEERKISLTQLHRVKPPVSCKRATIVSSNTACADCKKFCERVNSHFRLELFLQTPTEDGIIPRDAVKYAKRDFLQGGEGSFGTVYTGKYLETKVAIKCVKIRGKTETERRKCREAIQREVSVWRKTRHPNIVQFIGACYDGSSCLLVSEYASGGTLKSYLNDHRKADRSLVWRLLHEVALGLYCLHECGIVHSDLKSNNIVVGDDGKAKLIDFGLSFKPSESDLEKISWAALQYRPPEYVLEHGAGPSFAGDVYSLGMCILEAVTGERPWGGAADFAIRERFRKKEMVSKPPMMLDSEWELVEEMCVFEPSARMLLPDVIERLRSLGGNQAPTALASPDSIPLINASSRQQRTAAYSATAPGSAAYSATASGLSS